jgi:hypothetical protein
MKTSTNFVVAIIVAALYLFSSNNAVADTYQVITLISDNGINFYGMDDSGHVSFLSPPGTYFNFLNGTSTGTSITAPNFVQDNGTPCTPVVPPGASVVSGVCNNGRQAFAGFLTAGQVIPGIYEGPPFAFVAGFSDNGIFMNANGDIVFNDPFNENWNEAIDLSSRSVPEPGSVLLIGTGLLTVIHNIRRRLPKKNL